MDQSHIDDIFRAGLKEHQTPINNDELWASINNKSSKKSGFIFLKLLGLALIAVSLASALLFVGTSEKYDYQSENFSVLNTAPPYTSETSTLLKESSSNEKQENISNTAKRENTLPENNLNSLKNEPVNKASKKQLGYRKDRNILKATQKSKRNKNQMSPVRSSITKTQKPTLNLLTNNYRNSTTNQLTNNSKTTVNQKSKAPLVTKSNIDQSQLSLLSKINTLDSESIHLSYNREKIENNKKVECYSYNNKTAKISIEAYSLVDLVLPSMKASEPEFNDYLTERKESQTQREGYRVGLRMKYKLPNSIYIKAGLEYGHMRERFSKETTSTVTEILPDQLLEIIERADSTIYIYGDAPVTTIRTNKWRVNNSYKTIGVPLLLGYDYQGRKLTYGLELGAIYNLNYDFDGYLLNSASDTPEPVSDYFKSSINTSITGGITVNYLLNKHFDFFLHSSFRHNLYYINTSINLVNQKNTRIGLGAGISYKIN